MWQSNLSARDNSFTASECKIFFAPFLFYRTKGRGDLSDVGERAAGNFFQHPNGRLFRRHQTAQPDDECLLERVLSRQNGVRHGIRKTNPSRASRKFNPHLRGVGLEVAFFLQVIMKTEHEPVVGGVIDAFQSKHLLDAAGQRMAARARRRKGVSIRVDVENRRF